MATNTDNTAANSNLPHNMGSDEDRVEAMTRKIADLLASASGETFLAKLFWDALDYERVNQPIPISVLPERDRSDVAEAKIIARCEQLPICYVKLLTPELLVKIQTPVLKRLAGAWPTVLTVFSNFGASEWDFVWQNDAQGGRVHRICVDRSLFGQMELGRQLYALKAYDLNTEDELTEAQVVEKVDRVFRRMPRRLRWRRLLRISPLLREIGRWELLSATEERQLRGQFDAGGRHPARDRMVYANLRLVLDIAKRYRGRGMDWEDLVQEGCIGLMRAADKFEPERGNRFSTYATWWIRQRIQRAVIEKPSIVVTPVHMAEAVVRYRNFWRDSFVSRGFAPTPEEVCQELGLNPEQYAIVRQAVAAYVGVHRLPEGDAFPSPNGDPLVAALRGDLSRVVRKIVRSIDKTDKVQAEVIRCRFGLRGSCEQTLEEIGQRLNVTRERIRQIEAKVLARLTERLSTQWKDWFYGIP